MATIVAMRTGVVLILVAMAGLFSCQTRVEPVREKALGGDPEAQFKLGVMYSEGDGVQQDYAEAAKWFRLAAEQGTPMAILNMGLLYENGTGVPQSYEEAARWLHLGAELGSARSQVNLSRLYYQGRGLPRDLIQSHKWANLALTKETDETNAKNRAVIVSIRERIENEITPEQLAEAQHLAVEWKPRTWDELKGNLKP